MAKGKKPSKTPLFPGLETRGVKGLYRYRASVWGKQESAALGTSDVVKATKLAKRIQGFAKTLPWEDAVAKAFNRPIKKKTGKKTTIEEFIRLYEEFNLPATNPEPVDPDTAEHYFYHLKWVAKQAKAEFIEDFEGREFHEIAMADGLKRANATVNNKLRSTRALFKKPVLKFLRSKGIEMDTPFKDDILLKERVEPYQPFDKALQKEIWDDCEMLPKSHAMIIKMALGVGLRRAEIEHAAPEWFKQVNGDWWCYVRAVGNWSPKYGKTREIPLMDGIAEKLFELRKNALDYTPDCEWMIPCGMGSTPKSRLFSDMSSVRKWLHEKGVGKGSKDPKVLHMLRKQYGSAITKNHGIYVASKYLGHASVTTTEKHYANLIDKPKGDIF